jgi:plastocyanin
MSVGRRFGLAAAAAFVTACSASESTAPAVVDTFGGSPTALSVDVVMPDNNVFNPNNISIAAGGVVRFIFPSTPHDVRFGGNASAPADIFATQNVTVVRTFTVKGTFAFVCTLHDNMAGKVIVN